MSINTCERCGKQFQASTRRTRFCYGVCDQAHKDEHNRQRRAAWTPERRRASGLVNNAIHSGRLKRQPCEVCGKSPADGHHDDYSKPLEVRWLCRRHHLRHHAVMRKKV